MPKTITAAFTESVESRYDRAAQRQRAAARRIKAKRQSA